MKKDGVLVNSIGAKIDLSVPTGEIGEGLTYTALAKNQLSGPWH